MKSPIEIIKGDDGVFTVYYFGKVAGWLQPSAFLSEGRRKGFRALSIHGDLKHVWSLNMGKDWVLGAYF
jgi:hypothetical protein